ncbi:MAG: hypothetical protein K6B28_01270 [Lachnospiraceae bacterium]|nr:hypothetical protein [Lachnospiraceae bacterium]
MSKKIMTLFVLFALLITESPLKVYAITEENRPASGDSEIKIINPADEGEDENEGINTTDDESTKALDAMESMSKDPTQPSQSVEYEEIIISTAEDIDRLSKNCSLDTWSVNKKVILSKDIALFKAGFKPIPTFGGIFDGRGHTIKGIGIGGEDSYVGLFSFIQPTGIVMDLNVEGIIKPASKAIAVGGVVGDNYGIVDGCTFTGTVEGNNYVGGICGFNEAGALILNCESNGVIKGNNYTGGVCGENAGGISDCTNKAEVNTTMDDATKALADMDISVYKEKLMSLFGEDSDTEKTESDRYSNPVDTGGIAGVSLGAICNCINEGEIGYEHVGYNTGGIAGRTSGYLYNNINLGSIMGRKDIGGITGQAEPYVQLDLTDDIIKQITDNVNVLHDRIDTTLKDAGASSDTITMRLNVVKAFADKALDDTDYLANSTITFIDGAVSAANDALGRIQYVLDESSKSGGVLDRTSGAATSFKNTFTELKKAVDDADVYKYMSDSDKESYDNAKNSAESATNEYESYLKYVTETNRSAYMRLFTDKERDTGDATKSYYDKEHDLYMYHDNGDGTYIKADWPGKSAYDAYDHSKYSGMEKDGTEYSIDGLAHFNDDGTKSSDYPASEGDQSEYDTALAAAAEKDLAVYSEVYAEEQYSKAHPGHTYSEDLKEYVSLMTEILAKYEQQVAEAEQKDIGAAIDQAKTGAEQLSEAGSGVKSIIGDLSSRGAISMNMLGSDYQTRANSLNINMQGISDNLGFLNNEMSGATDVMINDLSAVNDQFNTLMLLFTDAMDGALEMDYSTKYEDNSENVADNSIDGTVASCINQGTVKGDIDTAGIIGTMAIDYDFDLESDATGVKDSNANSSYISKCVSRDNTNRGKVWSVKSYTGGITGLMEMGTILGCSNYGNIYSDSGDYLGGIAGRSLSTIKGCRSKGVLKGSSYVGGISGMCSNISDSYTLVNIKEADRFYGAIAGFKEEDAILTGNCFVSDELCGVDRISYQGKAEPVSYKELMSIEGIPQDFEAMTVTFTEEDEDIGAAYLNYGDSLENSKYPDVKKDEDCYIKWEEGDYDRVVSDIEIEATEVRYITTLAGDKLREDGQSIVLTDGKYTEDDEISVEIVAPIGIPLSNVSEVFEVRNPEDGEQLHTLRYHPVSEDDEIEIYINNNGTWQKTGYKSFGRYKLFTYGGNEVEFAVCRIVKDHRLYIIAGIAAGVLALIVIIYLMILNAKRKRNRKKA